EGRRRTAPPLYAHRVVHYGSAYGRQAWLPVGDDVVRKGQRYPPEVRSQEEVERLLDACGRSFTGRRNRALLVLLWRCGLRLSEALALEPRDVRSWER